MAYRPTLEKCLLLKRLLARFFSKHDISYSLFLGIHVNVKIDLQIPSLNDTPLCDIPPNKLIRFRAMIQNTGLDHEIIVSVFESLNANGGQVY